MDMWEKIQVFFKECMEEKDMAEGTEGENILESMESIDLALVNTFFNKNDEHLIIYNQREQLTN